MPEKVATVISHWFHLTEGLRCSSQPFYQAVEGALQRRMPPGIEVSRITYREGGILSSRREYLRVRRKDLIFDICAAPFGPAGFFVSWWLGERRPALWSLIPFLGPMLGQLFRPLTYYRLDSALMFQETVRAAVLEVLDSAAKAYGLRAISEVDRKPILLNLFPRTGQR